ALYRSPETHPRVTPAELTHIKRDVDEPAVFAVPWVRLLGLKQTWAFAAGKLFADPVWWFYLYWLPKFLDTKYGIRLAQLALPLIVVYVIADVGSVGGGGVRGWHRRVRGRHGRRAVSARHRPDPPGERQRLHAHLHRVRAGLRVGLDRHSPPGAAARARGGGGARARVTPDTSLPRLAPGVRVDAEPSAAAPDRLRRSLARIGPALVLVLVVLVFALLTDAPARYLSPFNLRIVLSQTVIVALGAIGMTIIIVSGGIDLSVGATIALTGVGAALVVGAGWPAGVATFAAVLAGGLVGLANGLLITSLRVVPFIATLGMLGIARGVAKWLSHE